ncbi:hypothetical protein M422DRAFT_259436 [Sphaerobolus stellatus SS14]|uniref:Uncharacterized protein n=1 Tax=Sphaerobolus stellatus (strain SS14) TaxID=990650 RepID=A0A0C9U501_SPHS4|nr:hypothetical protein M422DRAFT_259436 [Sphaerobolus stellatus SS14]
MEKGDNQEGNQAYKSNQGCGGFWPSVALQVALPILYWMFGFCLSLKAIIAYTGDTNTYVSHNGSFTQDSLHVIMHSVQWPYDLPHNILSQCPQPAAYRHIQTLADLIDDWAPDMAMWWGHKEREEDHHYEKMEREIVHHEGTSDKPLSPVSLDYLYG